ncbi:hypothetical protein ACL03H_23525 [Saccharopolyspora sp. MS10]|uniref:hypothetical protein n=1 Tax=Saccharopolyspora sp. MS10 TaxID=3385973 RepID=UPI00399F0CF2
MTDIQTLGTPGLPVTGHATTARPFAGGTELFRGRTASNPGHGRPLTTPRPQDVGFPGDDRFVPVRAELDP